MTKSRKAKPTPSAESYKHPEATSLLRPDVGTQAQFKKKKPPQTYRYDSSLSPNLDWDGQNGSRGLGEWLLSLIEKGSQLASPHAFERPQEFKLNDGTVLATVRGLRDAVDHLKRLGRPFLNWAGKAERLSFEVPTLPLFVHERLATKAIVETLGGHKRDKQRTLFQLFGDPEHSITDQILRAYEYQDQWTNRLILGDSLVVMNSLLHFEGLGGQVQMIYMDPPYGVKFGSNFQPFVRKRDVVHNDDEHMTREPEMVQAYRDTWELGAHSYLTYLRDRLLLARELLSTTGSMFVQISDDNLHHLREVMDEVFGADNFVAQVAFRKTGGQSTKLLPSTYDYVLNYARDRERMKFRPLWLPKKPGEEGAFQYTWAESEDGLVQRKLTENEVRDVSTLPEGYRVFRPGPLTSPGASPNTRNEIRLQGRLFTPGPNRHWSLGADDTERLDALGRVIIIGNTPCSKLYLDDFPVSPLKNVWNDTGGSGFAAKQLYAVQTDPLVIQRCILMATDPGDLVLDPTCGSGTTAYVAEQWGRRWIAIDTSRVPLALARQRLLTATFRWYELKEDSRGPVGGFVYRRKQNKKGEEVGGIVPHVTLKSIANDEPPGEEVLVDRPEEVPGITRVTGRFTVEATIPTPVEWEGYEQHDEARQVAETSGAFLDRMLEVLRKTPVLRLDGNRTVTFTNVRAPTRTLSLSAEALVKNGSETPVAFVFGPENGAVSEKLAYEAAREAHAKSYAHLYVIGFAIEPNARTLVDRCADVVGVPATYVQATPDLLMGDLLKNMRSSQIFSVCGLPEVKIDRNPDGRYQVELVGLDVFDPVSMDVDHRGGNDVPAWFLDTDYNGLSFHVCQAFFPRTSAWDNLKKALKAEFDETVWDHLAGTKSAPFEAGEHKQVAVKVIDDRGNELVVVKPLEEIRY